MMETRDFYNNFVPNLAKENARHKRVYIGLDQLPMGDVLDIGCGAGLTSKRLAERGRRVIAVDFADKAIEYAKANNNHPNIEYVCSNICDYKPEKVFNAISMVDVIEHLDLLHTKCLFDVINQASDESTILYVNIPYEHTLNYLHNHHRDLLQPVDEPYGLEDMVVDFRQYGFVPFKMELYWVQYLEMFLCRTQCFDLLMKKLYGSN